MLYFQLFQLLALANFSTYFQFNIDLNNEIYDNHGDGLALFMAPFELEPPEDAYGGFLGLFNEESFKQSSYQMVAVQCGV